MTGTPILEDVRASFSNESLFVIDARTGMTPGAVKAVPVLVAPVTAPAPVAGNWVLDLTTSTVAGTSTTTMQLTLNQYEDAVVGYGSLVSSAGTQQVSAGGSVSGDRMLINVIPVGAQGVYRLSLTYRPGSLDGNYILSSPAGQQLGVVFGRTGGQAVAQQVQPQTQQQAVSTGYQQTTQTQQTGTPSY